MPRLYVRVVEVVAVKPVSEAVWARTGIARAMDDSAKIPIVEVTIFVFMFVG